MVFHSRRQTKPGTHRLLPDRVAGRRKCRCVERADSDPADRRIPIPFPIEGAAAIPAKMKTNAIAAVGVTFVDLPLPVEPYPRFRKSSAKMEGGPGTALACFAVAQIDPIRFTRGYHSQRAAVALPGSFHRHSPSVVFP